MADEKKPATTTWNFQDFMTDNKITITELPQKTQDLISKFPSLTDKDAMEAMDEKIYGHLDDYMEAKVAKEKSEKVKAKIAEGKKKKEGLDVSKAATAKTPEQEAEEKKKAEAEAPKVRTPMSTIFGRKS